MAELKIAITGGIGSGKSTVAEIIKNLGYKVFSCDKIAHALYKTDAVKEIFLVRSDGITDVLDALLFLRRTEFFLCLPLHPGRLAARLAALCAFTGAKAAFPFTLARRAHLLRRLHALSIYPTPRTVWSIFSPSCSSIFRRR